MAATTFRSNDTTTAAVEWSGGLYVLIEAGQRPTDRLAACVPHQGAHVHYLGGCHALPPHGRVKHRRGPADRVPTVRVEIDVDGLAAVVASAVVTGLRASRGERRR